MYGCLQKLDVENLRINLAKSHDGKTGIELLDYGFTPSGIWPLENKTAANFSLILPTNLKKLRSFLVSVNTYLKINPIVSFLTIHSEHRLKKTASLFGHLNTTFILKNKQQIIKSTKAAYCNPNLEMFVDCDASRASLGATSEQLTVAFTLRFLY